MGFRALPDLSLNLTRISSLEDGTHRLAGRASVNEPLTHLWGRGIAPVPMSSHRRQSCGFSSIARSINREAVRDQMFMT